MGNHFEIAHKYRINIQFVQIQREYTHKHTHTHTVISSLNIHRHPIHGGGNISIDRSSSELPTFSINSIFKRRRKNNNNKNLHETASEPQLQPKKKFNNWFSDRWCVYMFYLFGFFDENLHCVISHIIRTIYSPKNKSQSKGMIYLVILFKCFILHPVIYEIKR